MIGEALGETRHIAYKERPDKTKMTITTLSPMICRHRDSAVVGVSVGLCGQKRMKYTLMKHGSSASAGRRHAWGFLSWSVAVSVPEDPFSNRQLEALVR